MSTSVPQSDAEVKSPVGSLRTRMQPIGGRGKSVYVMLVCLALSIIGAIVSGAYSTGAIVSITSNAPGAIVQIDVSKFSAAADASGAAHFQGVPHGSRALQISHQDYEPVSAIVNTGWLSANVFPFTLKPIPLTLTINTLPEAEVLLNNQSAGHASNQGIFTKEGVMPGDYDIQVKLPGYSSFHITPHLSPPSQRFYAGLNVSPERQRQAEEEQRRVQENSAKSQQLLSAARQQFNARQYKAALASVDEALKIEPGNVGAQQLKTQVVQIMEILK